MKNCPNEKECTSGQLSLAWLMNQGDDIFPIKKIKDLEENRGAYEYVVTLTPQEDKQIRQAIEVSYYP